MKRAIFLCVIVAIIFTSQFSFKVAENDTVASEEIRTYVLSETDSIIYFLGRSIKSSYNKKQLVPLYSEIRKHYKHIEFFIEYYSPREAKFILNGPLVFKHDEENGKMIEPRGLQKIEEFLFSKDKLPEHRLYEEQLNILLAAFLDLKKYYVHVELNDGLLLELIQFEIYRICALNLNGYDATLTGEGIKESAYCMEGLMKSIQSYSRYKKENAFKSVVMTGEEAYRDLLKNPDFNSFDRLKFITSYTEPFNTALIYFHNECKLSWNNNKQALILNKTSFFSEQNFNLRYFSIYYDDTLNLHEQAALGKKLFFDPLLSSDNTRSCATCHSPERSFTDGLKVNSSLDGTTPLLRNTPSLFNVAFQKAFFYDGRAYQLEQQISDVIGNKLEMHGNLDEIIVKLRKNNEYVKLFDVAFKNTSEAAITPYSVQKAITEYEKTIVVFNTRFDQYLQGDHQAINDREKNGYNLFAGKALCGSCHFFPLFNGTVPPFYNDTEFEVLGVPATKENKGLDIDAGRQLITGFKEHLHAFKTPGLRNVEFTAPYMHNGVYNTLEEVIEFYHKGGGKGLGYQVKNQTLPFDSLQLNSTEKADLLLFLISLSAKDIQ